MELQKQDIQLCQVCYQSMLGVWIQYPEQYSGVQLDLGKLVAWCTNHLRDSHLAATQAGLGQTLADLMALNQSLVTVREIGRELTYFGALAGLPSFFDVLFDLPGSPEFERNNVYKRVYPRIADQWEIVAATDAQVAYLHGCGFAAMKDARP